MRRSNAHDFHEWRTEEAWRCRPLLRRALAHDWSGSDGIEHLILVNAYHVIRSAHFNVPGSLVLLHQVADVINAVSISTEPLVTLVQCVFRHDSLVGSQGCSI